MSSEIIEKEDLNSLHIVGGGGTKLKHGGNSKLNQLSYYFEVSSSFAMFMQIYLYNLINAFTNFSHNIVAIQESRCRAPWG